MILPITNIVDRKEFIKKAQTFYLSDFANKVGIDTSGVGLNIQPASNPNNPITKALTAVSDAVGSYGQSLRNSKELSDTYNKALKGDTTAQQNILGTSLPTTSSSTGAKFIPTDAKKGYSATPITPLPTTTSSTGAKFIPTSALDAMNGISATPIISLDDKQKYKQLYGDFAPGTFSFGEYKNPYTSENLALLDQINGKNGSSFSLPNGVMGSSNNTSAFSSIPTSGNTATSFSMPNWNTGNTTDSNQAQSIMNQQKQAAEQMINDAYAKAGIPNPNMPSSITTTIPQTPAMPTTTDNNQKMLDEYGITLPNWNSGNTTDPNQAQSIIDQQKQAAEQKINDAYAKAGIPNPNTPVNTSNEGEVLVIDNLSTGDTETFPGSPAPVDDTDLPKAKSSDYTSTSNPTFISSNASSSTAGTIMSINNDNIGEIISRINQSVSEIESSIGTIENSLISKINSSWIADEASTYTSKVTDSINRTKYIIESLKLLSQTYTKALNESTSTQQDVSSTVSNI